MNLFSEYVQDLGDRFPEGRALLVLDDKTLRRYVLCWGPALVRRLNDWPEDSQPATLWDCVEVNLDALADLAGDTLSDARARLRQIQGLGLVLPDGSLPAAVMRVLTTEVQRAQGV